ncbi:MAG: carbohydrate ABC transporter substrate-binding protein, CUT1 family [uncultured archaeon A07HB70]|nr:MAG: carbohydrate ABC transporter substrate-binding protein, CUT1 family [uncultured archaeon A07HB70]
MTDERDAEFTRRTYVRLAGLAGVAGMTGLAGCSGSGGSGGSDESGGDGGAEETDTDRIEKVTQTDSGGSGLEIVHWWTAGGEKQALLALLEGFSQEHPEVETTNNPAPGGAGSALDTVIRNRVLNENPPSTFQIWPGQSLTPYTEADVLEPIDDVWSESMRQNYRGGVQDLATAGTGSFVSVPINIHRLNNLFYNVEVVESAGVDPTDIDDPNQLESALDTVAQETDAVPMAHQTQAPWSTLQLWEDVFVGTNGVDTYREVLSGDAGSYESEIRAALEQVSAYSEYYNGDSGSISWDQANAKVVEGDAAFIHQGDWAAGQYRAADSFEFDADWGMTPFPGTSGVYHVVTDSFVFPSSNPSPEATRKFLSYCGTVDAQERFNPVKGSIPPRTDVPTDAFGPFLQSQIEDFRDSDTQPPTIAHGTGVSPEAKSNIEEAFAGFVESYDVDRTYRGIRDAF